MILIGQYDSPFVRRVAIALRLYEFSFEHRPWSVFADAARVAAHNPLIRVPTLVLESGEILIESAAILDYLDELVGSSKALIARQGSSRRRALKICALAIGIAEKAVALVYQRVFYQATADQWIERCRSQIYGVLDALESERAEEDSAFWFGETIGHADIAIACALRFGREAHPLVFNANHWPSLAADTSRCELLEPFKAISQTFLPPT